MLAGNCGYVRYWILQFIDEFLAFLVIEFRLPFCVCAGTCFILLDFRLRVC